MTTESAIARNKRLADSRRKLCEEVGKCMLCGRPIWKVALVCHEILRGVHKSKAMEHRECILVLCDFGIESCHEFVQDWPLAQQLALKLSADPWWFSLDTIRQVKGRGRLVDMRDIRDAGIQIGLFDGQLTEDGDEEKQ